VVLGPPEMGEEKESLQDLTLARRNPAGYS